MVELTGAGPQAARGHRQGAPGAPSVGTAVTLVPMGDARLLTGTLLWWQEPGPDGAEVGAGVDIAPTSLRGGPLKVWATLQVTGGDIVVLSADGCPGETPQIMELTGRVAAREPRRRSVRASAHVDVEITVPAAGGRTLGGRTLDLSVGGCRVALETGEDAPTGVKTGQPTDVVIHLDRDNRPRLHGHVHAVRPGGQVVVRFDDVPALVGEQIQRYVYATLP